MKYSDDLTRKAKDYLKSKLGNEPDEETVQLFLTHLSTLGTLFLKNVIKLQGNCS